MNVPVFIALEALDGVGKTTLAADLADRLRGIALDTPGVELRAASPIVLSALGRHQTARCLFYAASVLVTGERARSLVQGGSSVVMDRYWLSTISYARARGVALDLRAIEEMIPPPDATVLVTLDEDERQRRLRARGCTEADRETLAAGFRERVLAEMMSIRRAATLRPTIVVDVSGADRTEATQRVLHALDTSIDGMRRPVLHPEHNVHPDTSEAQRSHRP